MADMYGYQQKFQTILTNLWKCDLPREDKEEIEIFLRDQKARGKGLSRLIKLCQVLRLLRTRLGKPFDKAAQEDIMRVVHDYESGEYSAWFRHDVKVIFKQYFAWLNKGVYPQKVQWINTTMSVTEQRLVNHGELLSQDEVQKVIDVAGHPRNKALLAVMAESGARPGEIGNLTIGQVDVDTNGVVLNLHGKTGSRRIRVVSATPYLVTWLNNHPQKETQEAPLWTSIGSVQHKQITYAAMCKVMKEAFEKAGIKKRAFPYAFRHTRACQLAHHLTEFQMNAYFGWVQGSDMPATYVHISGKDLDEHILRINGMTPGETPVYAKPRDRVCPRCKEVNSPTALYCGKCAEIVDPALALKIQMQGVEKPVQHVKSPFLEWLQNDPEMRDVLKRKAEEFREDTTVQR